MTEENFANFQAPIKQLGGATKPAVYILPCNVKVVYKRKIFHPSSNYKSEVGAYLIDEHFGFNMVPMTVFRKVRGNKGSLQYFVSDTQSVKEKKNYKKVLSFIFLTILQQIKIETVATFYCLMVKK